MKRKQIKRNVLVVFIMAIVFVGCKSDDDNVMPITITTENFSVAIDENPTEGQRIGKVKGTASEGEVSFVLDTQTPDDAMTIDTKTGELKVKNASLFDFELRTTITGKVVVKSGSVSKEARLTITINDVDDNQTVNRPPVIDAQTFSIAENIKDDVVIANIAAIDPEGDTLIYTLTQNTDDIFELIPEGELSLGTGKKLDYETKTSYILTVEVSDGVNKASADITITVDNVAEPFVTTWKTTTNNEMITFQPDRQGNNYEYTIDWGDGTVEDNKTTTKNHVYATAGTYTVSVSGVFPMIKTTTTSDAEKLQTIEQWGDNVWESMSDAFRGCKNMTYNAIDVPNLSKVIDMTNMFSGCSKFSADLNNWDVSTVVNMSGVFSQCKVFNSDLNTWDVSNVLNMSGMFYNTKAFNGDLSSWNVSRVKNMLGMFQFADIFNSDISGWNVSSVTNMKDMFNQAKSFNKDISAWDVSKVTDMRYMFFKAFTFNGDLSNWNIQNVKNMNSMLSETDLSIANYDALLTKWAALPNLQFFVNFGVKDLIYCNAGQSRSDLINNKNWTITGDTVCSK